MFLFSAYGKSVLSKRVSVLTSFTRWFSTLR